jgi:hypothetical protein
VSERSTAPIAALVAAVDAVAVSMGLAVYYADPVYHVSVLRLSPQSTATQNSDQSTAAPSRSHAPVSWLCNQVECRLGTRDPVVFRIGGDDGD